MASKEIGSFIGGWIVTNVKATGFHPDGDLGEARTLASKCVATAAGQHISRADMEAEVGDLDDHMRRALNIAQAAKDAEAATARR